MVENKIDCVIEPYIIDHEKKPNNNNYNAFEGCEYTENKNIIGFQFLHDKEGTREVLCCITVYNEPGASILISLVALMQNVIFIHENQRKSKSALMTVCIIIDGFMNLSCSAVDLLNELNLFNKQSFSEKVDVYFKESILNSKALEDTLNKTDVLHTENKFWLNILDDTLKQDARKQNKPFSFGNNLDENLNVLLCIKKNNQGKLNSHWWFFNVICKYYQPLYCIQMDAGSVPKSNSISILRDAFEKNPQTAASASMIMINNPSNPFNILHSWQLGDFLYQKLLSWPIEAMGFLSVIPGQFFFLRWKAISQKNEGLYSNNNGVIQKTPLENYFRGLEYLNSFESNMYLAEDRILGFEIISSQKSNWNLKYIPSAEIITDPCVTLSELLQQRRRWFNSSFTCNLWLILNVGRLLHNRILIRDKIRTLFAFLWMGTINLARWFLPSLMIIFVNVFTCLSIEGLSNFPILTNSLKYLNICFLFLFTIQIAIFLTSKLKKIEQYIFFANLGIQLLLFASLIVFIVTSKFSFGSSKLIPLVLFTEPLIGLILARIYSKVYFLNLRKIIIQFFFLNKIFILQLISYSYCNIHDNSWGTKGLNLAGIPNMSKQQTHCKTELSRKFRNSFILLWLIPNILLVCFFCFYKQEMAFEFIEKVFFVYATILAINTLSGLYIFISNKIKYS